MTADLVLAVDLGTGGPKAALVTLDGDIVANAFEPTKLLLLPDGGAEQDPADWWDAIVRATRRVLGEPGVDPARVVGVGCSAQWSGTVPVDDRGRPLTRAVIWMDSRGAPQVRRATRGFPAVQGYGVGRLAAWVRRSGGAPGRSSG